ncbi:MAG: VanW family protein, partial [Clostridia bacterium]|nr:VanW family protein [Clostridia bacterium]
MQFQQGYQPSQTHDRPRRRLNPRGKRALLILAVLVLGGGLIFASASIAARAQQGLREQQALQNALSPYQNKYLPHISMDGIDLGGLTAQEGLDAVIGQIQTREGNWKLNLTYQGHTFYTVDYAFLGIQTDLVQVHAELERLYRLGKVGTLEQRKADMDALAAAPYVGYTTQSDLADEHLDDILSQIDAQLTCEPVNAYVAYFDPNLSDPFIIQPGISGAAVDVDAVKREVLARAAAGQSGSLEITPTALPPAVTEADVKKQTALLCRATTPISSTSTAYRTSNIRTAFSRINGLTLEPGRELSFNKAALDRTEKNGYLPAIEYGDGGLEQIGIGGGVCQASTTLYLASLKSGLEILERSPHASEVSYTTF